MFTEVGAVMQVAYLVPDIQKAILEWNALGVGPFFVQKKVEYVEQSYRGKPSSFSIAAAFAYFGEVQIELVQRLNDSPSCYREFEERSGFGVQHLGMLSKNITDDVALLESRGFKQIQSMTSALGVETVFFDTGNESRSVIELIQETPAVLNGLKSMKAACAAWDHSQPSFIEF